MTTLTLGYRAINNKIKTISLPIINWRMFYILGILSIISMLVLYVFLVNGLTRGTYLIKDYNKELNGILVESRILETNSNKTGLLVEVLERAKELSFEKTTKIKYVQILDNSLAKAK